MHSRLAGRLYPFVILASPGGQPPRLLHSATKSGPAARWIAPSTVSEKIQNRIFVKLIYLNPASHTYVKIHKILQNVNSQCTSATA